MATVTEPGSGLLLEIAILGTRVVADQQEVMRRILIIASVSVKNSGLR